MLQPVESEPTLGFVRGVVKQPDGTIEIVLDYGGWFGWFARPIAVPLDAMVLLGQYMEVVDLTPRQLDGLPTYDGKGTELPADGTIRVGLARPSH